MTCFSHSLSFTLILSLAAGTGTRNRLRVFAPRTGHATLLYSDLVTDVRASDHFGVDIGSTRALLLRRIRGGRVLASGNWNCRRRNTTGKLSRTQATPRHRFGIRSRHFMLVRLCAPRSEE